MRTSYKLNRIQCVVSANAVLLSALYSAWVAVLMIVFDVLHSVIIVLQWITRSAAVADQLLQLWSIFVIERCII